MPRPPTCKKKPYKTRLDALLALSRIDRKRKGRQETRIYSCAICSRGNREVYHLTSQGQESE